MSMSSGINQQALLNKSYLYLNNKSDVASSNATHLSSTESNPELVTEDVRHQLNQVGQNQLEEKVEELQSMREDAWQLALRHNYIESKKSMIDAYMVSATDTAPDENKQDSPSLVELYTQLYKREIQLKKEALLRPDLPENNGEVSIQPIEIDLISEPSKRAVQYYGDIAAQNNSSFMHIAV